MAATRKRTRKRGTRILAACLRFGAGVLGAAGLGFPPLGGVVEGLSDGSGFAAGTAVSFAEGVGTGGAAATSGWGGGVARGGSGSARGCGGGEGTGDADGAAGTGAAGIAVAGIATAGGAGAGGAGVAGGMVSVGGASSGGEVMIPAQCGQGPVVGGSSRGIRILPPQWLQWKSRLSLGVGKFAMC